MKKVINLQIPEPCHQDWQTMSPNSKGRHCASCAKTVIDFTAASDEEIIKAISRNAHLCGRFREQQLNRPLFLQRKEGHHFSTIAAATLISLLSLTGQESNAQGSPKMELRDSTYHQMVKGKIGSSVIKSKPITGLVVDDEGVPLPGANILIKGSDVSTQTDFDGNFTIKANIEDIVRCMHPGFETIEKQVTRVSRMDFKMSLDSEMLGEVIVTGGIDINYEYLPTKEELEAQKERRELSRDNYFKFYKRKNKQKKEKRRQKRRHKKGSLKKTAMLNKVKKSLLQIFNAC